MSQVSVSCALFINCLFFSGVCIHWGQATLPLRLAWETLGIQTNSLKNVQEDSLPCFFHKDNGARHLPKSFQEECRL